MSQLDATIIGGGIGGLTTALALRRVGITPTVYERASVSTEAGAGITMWSTAISILEALGIGDELHDRSETIAESELCGPDGVPFPDLWLGSFVASNDSARPICIHRAVFQKLLLDALGPENVVHNCEAVGVRQGSASERSSVRFANGQTVDADVTIAADGIGSAIRASLFPEATPVYDGQTVYRGIAPAPESSKSRAPFVAIGEGTRFGWEPLPDDEIYWFAGRYQPEHEPDDPDGRQAFLLRVFEGWTAPVGELISSTPRSNILRNDVYSVGPLQEWTKGRTTLLGDAAHAIPPHVGHGACLAIEDADSLAGALAEAGPGDIVEALRTYAECRSERTAAIFTKSLELGSGLQKGSLSDQTV